MQRLNVIFSLVVILCLASCGCKAVLVAPEKSASPAGETAEPGGEPDAQAGAEAAAAQEDALLTGGIEAAQPATQPAWLPQVEPAVETTLAAGVENVIQAAEGVQITAPAGLVEGELPALSVAKVSNAAPFDGFEALALYQVNLGDHHELLQPLTVTARYDAARLNPEFPAESQITGALWDETTGRWMMLPVTVDEGAQTVSFQTDHLSLLGLFYLVKYTFGCPTPHFTLWYDQDEVFNLTGNMESGQYEYCFAGHPDYIRAEADALEQAYKAYSAAGFNLPAEKISVVVAPLPNWSDDPQYDTLTGLILLPTDDWNDMDAMRHAAAHELFHLVQSRELSKGNYLTQAWWMEATADYAADKVAWENSRWSRTNQMGKPIRLDYLQQSIEEGGKHGYANAYLVDFLLNEDFVFPSFFELWRASIEGDAVITQLEKILQERLGQTWGEMYREFAQYMIFNPGSGLPVPNSVWTDPTNDREVIGVEAEINAQVLGRASGFYGIKTDKARFYQLDWLNENGGLVYVFYSAGDERISPGYYRLYPGLTATMPLDTGDAAYFLLINPAGADGMEFHIKIRESEVAAYTIDVEFDAQSDQKCAQESDWGTAPYRMKISKDKVTIGYTSAVDDPNWAGFGSEHTIGASGGGTIEQGLLKASFESNDVVKETDDAEGNPVFGQVVVNVSFSLSPNPDIPLWWDPVLVEGSSSVDLPPTYEFKGYKCSGTVSGLYVYPHFDFPAPPKPAQQN
jgi:hypothetical protein